jgi:hypothetical protein
MAGSRTVAGTQIGICDVPLVCARAYSKLSKNSGADLCRDSDTFQMDSEDELRSTHQLNHPQSWSLALQIGDDSRGDSMASLVVVSSRTAGASTLNQKSKCDFGNSDFPKIQSRDGKTTNT